ncbi:MAG: glycosyltransferase family 4 protein [Anaerosomatales bacterium]|nr:glycosyltransferase family 4 protein [Anaerosomatales bacterium]
MSRPKICIIQYNSSRFLTRVDRSARTLAEAGYEVVLIAIKDAETDEYEDRGDYVVKRVTLASRRLPARFGLRVLRFIEAVWKTFRAAYRERADIYDARDAEPLFVAHLAARLRRAKLVYDSDELNLDRNKPFCRKRWWRFLMRRFEGFYARRADAVITTDHGRADVLVERYGIPRPVVVLNVPDVFDELEPDLDFRKRALGDRRYLLIYQGVLIENRGIPEMMRAMPLLPECRLALVGYGHREAEYRAIARDEGLTDGVVFFDAVPFERLMRYTAAADIGMIPLIPAVLSYVYAAPNKLFEYMMAGLSVVVSDLPDMAKVVTEERIGTLIADPTSPESIADAVRRLIEGNESLTDVGARARAAALRRYNWAFEKTKLLETYRSMTES